MSARTTQVTRLLFLAAAFVAVAAAGAWLSVRPSPTHPPVYERESLPQALRRIEAAQRHHFAQEPFQPTGEIVFLGDSLTASLAVGAVAPGAVNYGIPGQTTELLLEAMPHYTSLERASVVVLTIGTVDMVSGRERGVEDRLAAIADRIPGRLVWNGLPPSTRVDVRGVNATIRRLCSGKPRCTYVPPAAGSEDLQQDGVHLRASGYTRWIVAMRAALAQGPCP